jgi:hypothetical protein
MGVNGQRHVPTALYPQGKDTQYPLDSRLGGPQSRSGHNVGDADAIGLVVPEIHNWFFI